MILAGVAMNFLFAWAVYFVFATIVGRYEDPATTLAVVEEFTLPPAGALLVGLPENIQITHINGDTVKSWNDVRELLTQYFIAANSLNLDQHRMTTGDK